MAMVIWCVGQNLFSFTSPRHYPGFAAAGGFPSSRQEERSGNFHTDHWHALSMGAPIRCAWSRDVRGEPLDQADGPSGA